MPKMLKIFLKIIALKYFISIENKVKLINIILLISKKYKT